ncbi:MAG TPA: AMP-binding protein [Methanoregula sp.]|nr:AMP-binding protein [Methanoregula sp.]
MDFVRYLFEQPRDPDQVVLLGDNLTVTYGELTEQLNRVSGWIFQKYGKDKKFLILADNSLFFILSYLGIMQSGNTAVLVETRPSLSDLKYIIDNTVPPALFVQKKYLPALASLNAEFITEETLSSMPETGLSPHPSNLEKDEAVAVIIFTSGSTGTKKGVMLTHKNLAANTESIIQYLQLTGKDRVCAVLPFFYCYGASLLHTHIRVGGSLVLTRKAFLGSIIKDIDKYQCTGFAGVPSTFQILINKTPFLKSPLPSLRYLTQAGGKLADKYITMLSDHFPDKQIFIMYGATEATARLSYLPPAMIRSKMGSIGKGIPGVTLAVLDENGRKVKAGELGEIAARGENIMKGYFGDPEGTAAVIRNGWLYTGDIGTADEEGYIYVTGRSKNIIKSGGYRISPYEVENVILSLANVIGCVVLGIPDDLMGESVVAVVQTKSGPDTSTTSEKIITHCNRSLPSYKVPQKVVFMDQFPLNSSGKVDAMRLKEIVINAGNNEINR